VRHIRAAFDMGHPVVAEIEYRGFTHQQASYVMR
jgi:hypothetical protein